jgi:hypothetical protein
VDVIKHLTEVLQSGIVSKHPSTINSTDTSTTITTQGIGYTLSTEIFAYDKEALGEFHQSARTAGVLRFISQLELTYKENLDAYRLLLEKFCTDTTTQVWTRREGAPRGGMIIGLAQGIQLHDVDGDGLNEEAIMSTFYAFADETNSLHELVKANLTPK